jgi:hypothetical protein
MKKITSIFILILLLANIQSIAKTEKYGTWFELEFRKDFLKNFAFSITPEFRFQDQFNLDEYMVQGKLSWQPVKFLSFAGSYRLGTEIKPKGDVNYSRIALDAQASQKFDRFEASLRTRYTSNSDSQDDEAGKYFRPRISLDYNIKGNKIKPFASYELFHNLNSREAQKSRMDVGFTRGIGKLHRVGLYYRLHDYFTDKQSIHILGIDYRLRLK